MAWSQVLWFTAFVVGAKKSVVGAKLCDGCKKSYIGETGRQFGIRLKEHQKDVEKIADIKFTRAARKASTSEQHKSAITDHVAQANHIIDWDKAKILDRDTNPFSRKIRESVEIRKMGAMAINRDEGVYTLDHVYDSLLKSTLHPGKETTIIGRFPGKSSEPKHLWSSHQARWWKLKSVSKNFGFVTQKSSLWSWPWLIVGLGRKWTNANK